MMASRVSLFFIAAAILSFACAATKQASKEDSAEASPSQPTVVAPQATASTESKKTVGPSAPTLAEVQEAVARVYLDAVMIDTSRGESFIVGDFNGDGSEDIAVVVRPAKGALPKLNSEYANWIVEDPQKVVTPDPNKSAQPSPGVPKPVRVQQGDLLLLILHGYRQAGWRDALARQTFLLRNAVGENIRAQSLNEASKAASGKGAQPRPPGDVIRERLKGQDGFLYWASAKYAWHQ
jgi:hypothetical protein